MTPGSPLFAETCDSWSADTQSAARVNSTKEEPPGCAELSEKLFADSGTAEENLEEVYFFVQNFLPHSSL
jgi:hypothetical protein